MGYHCLQNMMLLREQMIDAHVYHLMELVIASRLFSEFICLYARIRHETITCVHEFSASTLKILKASVLFPHIVHQQSARPKKLCVTAHKLSAWPMKYFLTFP